MRFKRQIQDVVAKQEKSKDLFPKLIVDKKRRKTRKKKKEEERRRRKTEWRWKDKVIEEVRDFNYLGITLTKCGSLKSLLKERPKKANIVMRQVWGIAEKKFKDDLKIE